MESELQKALNLLHDHRNSHTFGEVVTAFDTIVAAARKVANPDYKTATHALIDALATDLPGIGAVGEIGARIAVRAALGTEDTTICVHCGGTGAGEVQTPWKTNPCHHCDSTGITEDTNA